MKTKINRWSLQSAAALLAAIGRRIDLKKNNSLKGAGRPRAFRTLLLCGVAAAFWAVPGSANATLGTYPPNLTQGTPTPSPTATATPTAVPACLGTWDLVAPTGPSPRQHHAMAYDSTRHVIVLFGGSDSSSYKSDTWEWNGTAWTLKAATGPSPRNETAMSFDSARGVVVLFGGGQDNNPQTNNDTWEWNGTAWTLRATTGPSARVRHAMAYDSARGVTVLFGGLDASGPGGGLVDKGDTWEWNGTEWTLKATTGPSARESHAMVFDSARGKTVLFGGFNGSRLSDTWEWNGTAWAQVGSTGPSGRSDHGLAYQSDCARTILFGGFGDTGRKNDTWEWNGTQWIQIGSSGPNARNGHKMAYDGNRRQVVLFGGSSVGVNGETWEYAVDVHFGLRHSALGQATLSTDPTTGDLVVGNIGLSGQDGVSIRPGASDGLHLVMDLPPDAEIPVGASMKHRMFLEENVLGELVIERTANGFRHTPDFSMNGSPTYTMRLLRDGVLVYQRTGSSGPAGVAASMGARREICSHGGHTSQRFALTQWDLGGGVSVLADTLLADPETTPKPEMPFPGPGVLRMDFMASGISGFTIPKEFLMMFGSPGRMAQVHRAFGLATFKATPDQLTMANIGSSGQDGVRIDFEELAGIFGLPAVRDINVRLLPLSLLPGNAFNVSATGVFSGVAGSFLGQAGLRNNGGQMELSADFSPIGASTIQVQVFNGGKAIGSVDVPGGVVGTLGAGARVDGCGKLPPSPLPCFILQVESPVLFTPATGGTPMTGDEFRLLAANSAGTIDRLSFFDLSAVLAPGGEFSIVGESQIQLLPALTAVFSRKIHGGAGAFDILLPLIGPPGIECRRNATAFTDHTLVFTFNKSVVSGNASVIAGIGSVEGAPSFSGNQMTVNLTAVNNVQVVTVTISNVTDSDGLILPDTNVNMGVLLGDINSDGVVDGFDVAQAQSHIGQTVDATDFRSDVNVGGIIDATDVAIIQSNIAPSTVLLNISTRMRVQTGDNVGIGGFIITGNAPKHVLLRAIGPSLVQFGVPGVLANPVLELHGPDPFVTITNDNWRDTQEAPILATGIPPTNDLESAIDATLAPGNYTAVVKGNGNTTGVALVEVYDLAAGAFSKLANISTRASVGTGDDLMIAGFILGNGNINDRIVVRGIGPTLIALGIPNALANPTLELRDSNGALLVANNDWQDNPTQAAELTAAGLAPANNFESGIAATLPPGLYTALLAGLNNGTGVGLVEVYDLGPP